MILLITLFYALLLLWYRSQWNSASKENFILMGDDKLPTVAVIVPLRNEAKNILTFLEQIEKQNYPENKLQWIFIDDHSDDNTLNLLENFGGKNLTFYTLHPSGGKGKKAALKKGIEICEAEWIITSDADCKITRDWIRTLISKGQNENADMVCGTVHVKSDASFLQNFQAMETGILQISGAGSLHVSYPLLNSGASLAFKKSAWEEVQGYSKNEHIASGDDTFLMLSMHKNASLKVIPCVQKDAMVETEAVNSWDAILKQRLRWNGKMKHYPIGYIHLIGVIVFGASLSFTYLLILFFLQMHSLQFIILIFGMRFLAEYMLLRTWMDFTGKKFSWMQMLLMSVVYPLFTVFSMLSRPFMRNSWKGRNCE